MQNSAHIEAGSAKLAKRGGRRHLKSNEWQWYSMCAVPMLLVFVWGYLTDIGVIIAFQNYRYDLGMFGSKFVGMKNFDFLLKSRQFANILKNTVSLNLLFIVAGMAAAIFVAVMLYQLSNRLCLKVFQTVLITPHFISWVLVGYMAYALLNPVYGIANQLIAGLGGGRVEWYSTPDVWPTILTVASVWKHVGMDCIIYYAALMGVDSSLLEAGMIDGANRRQCIWHIMLPALVPLILLLLIMKVGGILNADFGLFYQLTRDAGALYSKTDVIATYVWRTMRVVGDMGMSSAAGLFQTLVGFVLVLITNRAAKWIDADSGIF